MLLTFRTVLLTCYFLLGCMLGLLLCLIRPFHRNNTHDCAKIFSLGRWLLNIKMSALNRSPVGDGQAVYVTNHQDTLDIFIYPGLLPGNITILGKSSLRFIPVFGLLFWLAGNIFINRKNKSKAWETMAAVAQVVKKRGCAVYIFPEGTRSKGRGMLPFKSGAFALAIEAGLPIVPIVYSSTHKNINLHTWRAGYAMAKYLPPISTAGLGEDDVRRLADECRDIMIRGVAELDAEIAALSC